MVIKMNGDKKATENATVASAQPLDAWFLDLLACPACPQHLPLHPGNSDDGGQTLVCQCGRYAFPIRDGLPILLVEEATLLNPDAHPEGTSHTDPTIGTEVETGSRSDND